MADSKISNRKLIGLALCGGQSSRMGSDKGLLKIHSQTWAAFAVEKLSAFCEKVYISLNDSQKPSYENIFSPELLVFDSVSIHGPLAGLLSLHKLQPDCDIFLLACDMVEILPETLRNLHFVYLQNSSLFYVYKLETGIEPLCGIYSSNGLKMIFDKLAKNKLESKSLRKITETDSLFLTTSVEEEFKSYNSREDIR